MNKLCVKFSKIFLSFIFFFHPLFVSAEEFNAPASINQEEQVATNNNSELIVTLSFNSETRVLSGETVPNANIYIADIVTSMNIVADENGHFEVPIPEEIPKSTITVMDVIGNQSTDIEYTFNQDQSADGTDQSLASTEPSFQDTDPLAQNNSASFLSSAKVTTSQAVPSSSNASSIDKKLKEKKEKLTSLGAFILIVIALLLLCLILLYLNNKKSLSYRKKKKRHAKSSHSTIKDSHTKKHQSKKRR